MENGQRQLTLILLLITYIKLTESYSGIERYRSRCFKKVKKVAHTAEHCDREELHIMERGLFVWRSHQRTVLGLHHISWYQQQGWRAENERSQSHLSFALKQSSNACSLDKQFNCSIHISSSYYKSYALLTSFLWNTSNRCESSTKLEKDTVAVLSISKYLKRDIFSLLSHKKSKIAKMRKKMFKTHTVEKSNPQCTVLIRYFKVFTKAELLLQMWFLKVFHFQLLLTHCLKFCHITSPLIPHRSDTKRISLLSFFKGETLEFVSPSLFFLPRESAPHLTIWCIIMNRREE